MLFSEVRWYQLVCAWLLAGSLSVSAAPDDQVWTLDGLVKEVANTNPQVLSKRLAVASAQSGVEVAQWQFYPTPSVSSQQYRGDYMATLSLRQPIWTGGKLTGDLNVARSRVNAASESIDEARYALTEKVISAWGNALASAERLKILEGQLSQLHEMQSMMDRRLRTGLGAQADVNLVRARVAQVQTEFAQTIAAEKSAMAALSQMAGVSIAKLSLDEVGSVFDMAPDAPEMVVQRAFETNPQLKRLSAEIKVAEESIKRAQADYWPSLSARVERQYGQVSGSLPEGGRLYVQFDQSFDAGLSISAKISAAVANRDVAVENLEAAKRDLSSTVYADMFSYQSARENEKAQQSYFVKIKDVSNSYQRMFVAGKMMWLNLLNTVKEQADTEKQLVGYKVQKSMAAYRLKLETGYFSWTEVAK